MGVILKKITPDTLKRFGETDSFFETLLTNMPFPVCVINNLNKIIFANPAFHFLAQTCPQISEGAFFSLRDKQAQLSFATAFDKVLQERSSSETVFVAAAKPDETLWTTLTPGGKPGTIMITILSPGLMSVGRETIEQRLRTLFGLTGMEARCALLLARGMSASAIAQQRGVSLPTIRTQLHAIRAKMRVTSSLAVVTQISKLAMSCSDEELRP